MATFAASTDAPSGASGGVATGSPPASSDARRDLVGGDASRAHPDSSRARRAAPAADPLADVDVEQATLALRRMRAPGMSELTTCAAYKTMAARGLSGVDKDLPASAMRTAYASMVRRNGGVLHVSSADLAPKRGVAARVAAPVSPAKTAPPRNQRYAAPVETLRRRASGWRRKLADHLVRVAVDPDAVAAVDARADAIARAKRRAANANANANAKPKMKTKTKTKSKEKTVEGSLAEGKPVTTNLGAFRRRPRPAAKLGGNATTTTTTTELASARSPPSSSSSSAASCDAPSRASWSWMDHWEGPHLTAHGGDDCHTLPQFLYTSRCEHVLAFERFDEEVMPFLTRRLRLASGGDVVDRSGSELRGRAGEAAAAVGAGARASARNAAALGVNPDGDPASSGSGEDAVAAGYRLNQCFNPAVDDSEEMRAARAAMRRVYARDFESLGYDPERLNLVESHHEWRKTKAQCRGGAEGEGHATNDAARRPSRDDAPHGVAARA